MSGPPLGRRHMRASFNPQFESEEDLPLVLARIGAETTPERLISLARHVDQAIVEWQQHQTPN